MCRFSDLFAYRRVDSAQFQETQKESSLQAVQGVVFELANSSSLFKRNIRISGRIFCSFHASPFPETRDKIKGREIKNECFTQLQASRVVEFRSTFPPNAAIFLRNYSHKSDAARIDRIFFIPDQIYNECDSWNGNSVVFTIPTSQSHQVYSSVTYYITFNCDCTLHSIIRICQFSYLLLFILLYRCIGVQPITTTM